MTYLVDIDWVIHALAGQERVATTLTRLVTQCLAISVITLGEVYEGAFTSVNPQAHIDGFRQTLPSYRVLPVTEPISERFAEVRSFLRRRGQLISDFDMLIAATAIHHKLTLLTFNLRHFERVPDLRIYRTG
jgi:predicted nucleic acid-binding protein